VTHLARDGWSGKVKKSIVNRKPPDKDIFFTPEDVLEATDTIVTLKFTFDKYGMKKAGQLSELSYLLCFSCLAYIPMVEYCALWYYLLYYVIVL